MRAQLGIICAILLVPAGCKPKRDDRCPSRKDQIDVSLQVALVDDYGSEGFLRSLDRDGLEASGLAFLREPVSVEMQGKVASYCIVVADGHDGRTGREILQSQIDEHMIPPSRALGYSRKPDPGSGGFLWRTYLLVDPPAIIDEDIQSALIDTDQKTGETVIHLDLNKKGRQALAQLTEENIDRRMAIVVNDEVLTTLLIREKNETGVLRIPLERLGHDDGNRWQHACGLLR